MVEDYEIVKWIAIDFFHSLFIETDPNPPEFMTWTVKTSNEAQSFSLVAQVIFKEIKHVLFLMKADSASGPDSYTIEFLKPTGN